MSNYLKILQNSNDSKVSQVFDLALYDQNKKGLALANFAQAMSNIKLQECDPVSVATTVAQMTNLGFSASTGESYIIPYNHRATFQMGYKGWISIALRSGQISKLNAAPIYAGEYKGYNRITGDHQFETSDIAQKPDKIIGYVGYLLLKNGFEKTIYLTKEELHLHFAKFSKNNYDVQKRVWKSNIITIDQKSKITVLKQIISKWAPKDASMDLALKVDGLTANEDGNITLSNPIDQSTNEKKQADKEVIINVLTQVGKTLKLKGMIKNKTEANKWMRLKANESAIDFHKTSGWYGITIDQLKAFCVLVEKELSMKIIVNNKRLSLEKPESEKSRKVDLDD